MAPSFDLFCGNAAANIRVYCDPRFFKGLSNLLYHNQGHGTFKDVSAESGIAAHVGKGMSAAVADYDQDDFPDIFVTNDKLPNFLFHNLRNGHFEEVAFQSGVALLDSAAKSQTWARISAISITMACPISQPLLCPERHFRYFSTRAAAISRTPDIRPTSGCPQPDL